MDIVNKFQYLLMNISGFSQIFISCFLLGIAAGITGLFMVLQKKDLLGDTLAHTTLPGIATSYILFRQNKLWVIWLGAIFSSLLTLFLIEIIKKYSKIKLDAILSFVMISFFGLGNVLMSYILSNNEDSSIANLEKTILGQAALMNSNDHLIVKIITFLTIFTIIIFYKELKMFTFDSLFSQSIGFNNVFIIFIFNILLIGVIIISLKVTGIILTSALLILPGVISRQISDQLFNNIIIICFISFFVNLSGVIISILIKNIPTGPVITVITTFLVFLVFLFGPKQGIVKKYFQQMKYKKKIRKFRQLIHFYNTKKYYSIDKIDFFLFKKGYLYMECDKILMSQKGSELVENLINGKF
ncbi:ABC-type Mn/Zn transport system permease protein [Candidatus Phytoplasma luffae]|uniref:ABC-type Mn/Zn transport system permease protein n=1 Tax=Loofah witches'-broom phytoplasma TaxID=35773 RepID=A0A975FHR2_LOWBP|nr:metal ABC transporter permease [Candidatus Phytoplasma luffae]QTX02580.1 ABC-type Mn/Zn transport system permease protein [Candidatus Phytoplasma luffae]